MKTPFLIGFDCFVHFFPLKYAFIIHLSLMASTKVKRLSQSFKNQTFMSGLFYVGNGFARCHAVLLLVGSQVQQGWDLNKKNRSRYT